MRWILLVATVISFYMTLETIGVIDSFKENANEFGKRIWGNTGKDLPRNLKTSIENKLQIWAVLIPVATTILLARATYDAFF